MARRASTLTVQVRSALRCAVRVLLALGMFGPAALADEPIPAFAGRTPGVPRTITIPTIDISGETVPVQRLLCEHV
jgi:hypothetical protein